MDPQQLEANMSLIERLKAFMESEEGQKSMDDFVKKMAMRDTIRQYQIARLKKMFNDQASFDSLVTRILARHTEEYRDACYARGFMPSPQNLLYCLFDLAEEEGTENLEGYDGFTQNWPTMIFEYMGWGFAITHGQGSVCSVYKDGECLYRD